ncbi:MAG: biotin/lipoyl-binding protein, partial [Alphaproteobacteria bacterium]|nr:biotin/lipoyl-binding protein [Alphaproteobacteria bacterium]
AKKMKNLLQETHITGAPHNQEFIANVFTHKEFLDRTLDTGFIARHETDLIPDDYGRAAKEEIALAALYFMLGLDHSTEANPWNARDNWRVGTKSLTRNLKLVNRDHIIEIEAICCGTQIELDETKISFISYQDNTLCALIGDKEIQATILPSKNFKNTIAMTHGSKRTEFHILEPEQEAEQGAGDGKIIAPMPGKIVRVLVSDGETVETGQPLLVMESMKVEITIKAPVEGVVENLSLTNDAQVTDGTILMEIAA